MLLIIETRAHSEEQDEACSHKYKQIWRFEILVLDVTGGRQLLLVLTVRVHLILSSWSRIIGKDFIRLSLRNLFLHFLIVFHSIG